jgi:pilus assembly protein CpaF
VVTDDVAGRLHAGLVGRDASRPTTAEIREAARRERPLADRVEIDRLARDVEHRFDLLGPLAGLVGDGVSEVMVDGPGAVRVERRGRIERTDVMVSRAQIESLVERLLGPSGRRADQRSPIADARLPDGSRVNIVVPPVAVDGPYVTIRRFPAHWPPLGAFGPPPVVDLLRRVVASRRNVVVSGATGAGKTSLLRALLEGVADEERVITLEDAAELQIPGAVRLEARPPSVEGVPAITLRDLLRTALRMRPDRLVVGEVRGPEAIELVQALNTGHDGSVATVHANGPEDAIGRLAVLCLMADEALSAGVVEREIHRAVDVVVHVVRSSEGARRVDAVIEVGADLNTTPLVAAGVPLEGVS